jgi:hypothetical protein
MLRKRAAFCRSFKNFIAHGYNGAIAPFIIANADAMWVNRGAFYDSGKDFPGLSVSAGRDLDG